MQTVQTSFPRDENLAAKTSSESVAENQSVSTLDCFDTNEQGDTGKETWNAIRAHENSVDFASLCPPYDFGDIFSLLGRLTVGEKYKVVQNIYKPASDFVFPKQKEGAVNRCFRYEWLQRHCWLVYSKSLNGGFCVPCVMFAKGHRQKGTLVKGPLTKFKKAVGEFEAHGKSQYHLDSMQDMASFMSIAEQKQKNVAVQLNNVRSQRIAENRSKLRGILDTVILCGKQNIAFRGNLEDKHGNDDDTDGSEDNETETDGNPGNFQVLLDFRISAGDKILEKHFQTCPRNASYRSKTIQNQLIELCGDFLRGNIIEEVKNAKFFSVLIS